jgi:hypothetical protein
VRPQDSGHTGSGERYTGFRPRPSWQPVREVDPADPRGLVAHSANVRRWPHQNGVPVHHCGWGLAQQDEEGTTSTMVGPLNTRIHRKVVSVDRQRRVIQWQHSVEVGDKVLFI